MRYALLAALGGVLSLACAAALFTAVVLGGCAVTTVTVNNYGTVQR